MGTPLQEAKVRTRHFEPPTLGARYASTRDQQPAFGPTSTPRKNGIEGIPPISRPGLARSQPRFKIYDSCPEENDTSQQQRNQVESGYLISILDIDRKHAYHHSASTPLTPDDHRRRQPIWTTQDHLAPLIFSLREDEAC